jgi:hypothetical protein
LSIIAPTTLTTSASGAIRIASPARTPIGSPHPCGIMHASRRPIHDIAASPKPIFPMII